jgi:hypothetical protein
MKMMALKSFTLPTASIALFLLLAGAGFGGGVVKAQTGTIVDIVGGNANLTTLTAAVTGAGLIQLLSNATLGW